MTRSRKTARQAGTKWETTIVRALVAAGWPYAERRRLAGVQDRGDIAGVPGVVIEAKNTNRLELAAAVDEALAEAANVDAAVAAMTVSGTVPAPAIALAWIKRKGRPGAEDGYVVMDGRTAMRLLREAGY